MAYGDEREPLSQLSVSFMNCSVRSLCRWVVEKDRREQTHVQSEMNSEIVKW